MQDVRGSFKQGYVHVHGEIKFTIKLNRLQDLVRYFHLLLQWAYSHNNAKKFIWLIKIGPHPRTRKIKSTIKLRGL